MHGRNLTHRLAAQRLSAVIVSLTLFPMGCRSKSRWEDHLASQLSPRSATTETTSSVDFPSAPSSGGDQSPLAYDDPGLQVSKAEVGKLQGVPTADLPSRQSGLNSSVSTSTTSIPAEQQVNLRPEQFSQRIPNRRQLRTDKSDPSLFKQLATVGRDLAKASPTRNLEFEFLPLHNQQPRVHHTEGGQIYVSTGLLERITDKNELAAILAMEMAETLSEQQESDIAIAAAEGWTNRSTDGDNVDRIAAQILVKAGYPARELASVKSKLSAWSSPANRMVSGPAGRQFAN